MEACIKGDVRSVNPFLAMSTDENMDPNETPCKRRRLISKVVNPSIFEYQQKALWEPCFGKGWYSVLAEVLCDNDLGGTLQRIAQERAEHGKAILPPQQDVFRAFRETPFEDVRVVIVGQDPYHGTGQAMGLSFSVPRGVNVPPSLRNILKEATGSESSAHGDLTSWAKQGVLLLNTILTVHEGKAGSHRGLGWEHLTDVVISAINSKKDGVCFLLWGVDAMKKAAMISEQKHHVFVAGHPSPLAVNAYSSDAGAAPKAGIGHMVPCFIGCDHFTKVNKVLRSRGEQEVCWMLSDFE